MSTGSAPADPITAGTSITASSGRNGSVPWLSVFATCRSCRSPVSETSRSTAASEYHAPPRWASCGGLTSSSGSAYSSRSSTSSRATASPRGSRRGAGSRATQRLHHRVVVVVVTQVGGRHHAQVPDEVGGHPGVRRDLVRVLGQQLGQHVHAVEQNRTLPGQVVKADVSQRHPAGLHPEPRGEVPLEPDGHVAQADRAVPRGEQGAGDDAHGVGEVDDKSGGRSPTAGPFG